MKHLTRGLATLVALMAIVAGCTGAGASAAPTQGAAQATPQTVYVTPAPTTQPVAAKPTIKPTPVPTPEPVLPITLAEINAALATEDCDVIFAVSDEDRINVTTDGEVLLAGIDAAGRCLTGEYVAPTTLVARGKTARAGDWDVRVTGKVNFNAWKVVKRENMFNDPAPKGWKMVLIPLAFTNRGDAKASLLGVGEYVYGQGTLVERTDFDDPTCGVIPKDLDFFTDVRPGGTLKGNMCFVVKAADVQTLRFAVPQGLFDDGADVEFALR